jgi:hypothetical protein
LVEPLATGGLRPKPDGDILLSERIEDEVGTF